MMTSESAWTAQDLDLLLHTLSAGRDIRNRHTKLIIEGANAPLVSGSTSWCNCCAADAAARLASVCLLLVTDILSGGLTLAAFLALCTNLLDTKMQSQVVAHGPICIVGITSDPTGLARLWKVAADAGTTKELLPAPNAADLASVPPSSCRVLGRIFAFRRLTRPSNACEKTDACLTDPLATWLAPASCTLWPSPAWPSAASTL